MGDRKNYINENDLTNLKMMKMFLLFGLTRDVMKEKSNLH